MDEPISDTRLAAIEANLRTVTDRVGGLMDKILKKGFVPMFRCAHSGLLLPADYIKEFGRSYGIGLGPSPVSEVLDSDYHTSPAVPKGAKLHSASQIMHPVGPCMSQVDFDMFEPDVAKLNAAVLDKDDWGMHKRAEIVRAKQLTNPRSRIRLFAAAMEVR